MSRSIPVAMQVTLDGYSWSFCDCMIVTQQATGSSAVLRLTTFNAPLVIPSGPHAGTYLPLGYIRKDLTADNDMAVGTTEIEGILDSPYLIEEDIRIGRWDGAGWQKIRVNYLSPTDGFIDLGSGTLGSVRHGRLRFWAELLGLMQYLHNSIGNLNSPLCIHNFGAGNPRNRPELGNGCTFDLATVTFTGTVASVASDFYTLTDPARTEPDSYFSNGLFRIKSGPYTGMEREVRAYVVGLWVLFTDVPADITGETYEIVRGCNKTLRQCVDDFDNIMDRLASDYTQGNDAAVQVARHNS